MSSVLLLPAQPYIFCIYRTEFIKLQKLTSKFSKPYHVLTSAFYPVYKAVTATL